MIAWLAAVWGIGGLLVLLLFAIYRLGRIAFEMTGFTLEWYHWAILVVNVVFMAYSEGFRGFQQSFSPRVVARAKHLASHPRAPHVALAPLFCAGYFHTTPRRMISVYLLTTMIVGFVIGAQFLAQPWRSILDAGVVVGLLWGVLSIVVLSWRAVTDPRFDYSPELPSR